MRKRRLHDLFGPAPPPDRIFWSGLWFHTHNNGRYEELLPRLRRLDAYYLTCSERRIARGLQYRAYRRLPGRLGQRLLFPRIGRTYRGMLCTEFRQIPLFVGPVVVDVDDPFFFEPALSLFRRPNVVALVTLAGWAAARFRELGVTAPIHVIPQGVDLGALREDSVRQEATRKRSGEVVIGYHAAHLSTGEDRGVDPLYDVDHLLELWEGIRAAVPSGRLWLIGEPTDSLRRRVEGRDDVLLVGRLPRDRVLAAVASFDVALYPRLKAAGIQAAKVAEYLGAGVPTVSYDYPVVELLRERGAGVLVETPQEFVEAVTGLATNEPERRRLAAAAKDAARDLDWDALARRYESEILDRYLDA